MALSFTNYQLKYPTTTVTEATFDNLINIYKSQLSKYFRFDNTIKTKFINLDFCGQDKVFLKAPLILNNQIIIEEINKKTRMLKTLVNEVDFLYSTDSIDNQEYVYALDFECLGCKCACDQIKITGILGLQVPNYLEDEIYNLIESQSQVVTQDVCQEIESEKLGELFTKYRENTNKTQILNKNDVFSITLLALLVQQIQVHFFSV